MKSRLLSSLNLGTAFYSLYLFVLGYISILVCAHYQQQASYDLSTKLAQQEFQLNSELNRISHILYSIDAYLGNEDAVSSTLFYPLADSQLNTFGAGLSLSAFKVSHARELNQLQSDWRKQGYFDFRVILPSEHAEHYLVTLKSAPEIEFGHFVGHSLALPESRLERLLSQNVITLYWPELDKWSLLIYRQNTQTQEVLGVNFELSTLLEMLFGQLYNTSGHHIRLLSENKEIYSSDWQNIYVLEKRTPGTVNTFDFFGHELTLELYSESQLAPSILDNHQVMVAVFFVVAALCGLLVWLQVKHLTSRHDTINRTVIERTKRLAEANDRLKMESDRRVSALHQRLTAERKYKSLFINSNEGLFVLNHKGQLVDANPAFEELMFSERAHPARTQLEAFMLDPDFITKWQDIVVNTQDHNELEWLARTEDGRSIWLRQTGSWVHEPQGSLYEGRLTDITQIKLFNEQLKYKAQHDSLTDLLNRQTFLSLVAKARQGVGEFILLYIDLDRFKLINDTLGHLAGDKLLVEFSTRMRLLLGSYADLARLGGDEFAVLINSQKLPASLEGMLEDVLFEIRKPFSYQGHNHTVSGSIGVRIFKTPTHSVDSERLLHDADIAMYEAKRRGKNGYHIFSSEIACEASRKLQVERALNQKDITEELSLFLQPIYCQYGRIIKGFEALLRWNSPELGFVSPAEFIPIAEENGKIHQLGEWVLVQALLFMDKVEDPSVFMSVNVSPLQVQSRSFVPWLNRTLSNHNIQASQLKIELTESAMMTTEHSLIEPLEQIHSLGCGIYIDDFGTGYSSLARLNALPVDGLKIDRAFIEGIEDEGKPRQVIEAICAIAKSFNLVVTAEGIETQAQLSVLSELHCQQSQGYFMHKPVEVSLAHSLLIHQHRLRCV